MCKYVKEVSKVREVHKPIKYEAHELFTTLNLRVAKNCKNHLHIVFSKLWKTTLRCWH